MPEFRKIAQGVHVFLQPPLVWHSSAGVIIGGRDVILVDSLTNAAWAQSLRSEIHRVTDRPVRFLINTHCHADHVYTNHLFPEATTVCTQRGREQMKACQRIQAQQDALFTASFPDVDFAGGRYTLQDVTFSGSLALWQGEREIRVVELGPGHSESDVIVHLPAERIVFCGDLFVNDMPPLPGRGQVTQTIANMRALEALEADICVPGHGHPGTLEDVRAQRTLLEEQFQRARECHRQGMSYDEALQAVAGEGVSRDFVRMVVLHTFIELTGQVPETADPASKSHAAVLQGIAAEAKLALARKPKG